jgi:hypothetical protein
MDNGSCIFLEIINVAFELCSCLPLYLSKFSRKDFTVHQLLVLLVLKQKLKCSYDGLVDDLKCRPNIVNLLCLKRIPDPSTIRKFAKRIKVDILYYLLADCSKQIKKKSFKLAIDATGLHVEDGSFHYRKRLGLSTKKRKNVKLSAAVDTQTQLVTAVKLRKSKAGDNKDFIGLVMKSAKIKPIKIVVADKGYDSEKNHAFCNEKIKAECIIPPRNKTKKKYKTKGIYRKKLRHGYSKRKYHQRSKIESVFFVIKRLFGATLHSKIWHTQKIELLCKIIAYNAYRLTKLRTS